MRSGVPKGLAKPDGRNLKLFVLADYCFWATNIARPTRRYNGRRFDVIEQLEPFPCLVLRPEGILLPGM